MNIQKGLSFVRILFMAVCGTAFYLATAFHMWNAGLAEGVVRQTYDSGHRVTGPSGRNISIDSRLNGLCYVEGDTTGMHFGSPTISLTPEEVQFCNAEVARRRAERDRKLEGGICLQCGQQKSKREE